MDIVNNDYDWERAFAAQTAGKRYGTWDNYAKQHRLERFTRVQVSELREIFERWNSGQVGSL